MYIANSRLLTDGGRLVVIPRMSTGVNGVLDDHWAKDRVSGASYVHFCGAQVPQGSLLKKSWFNPKTYVAYTSDGALCVADDTSPVSGDSVHSSVRVRSDGAVYVRGVKGSGHGSGDQTVQSMRVSATGAIYVDDTYWFTSFNAGTPEAWYKHGVGITVDTGVSNWADQSGNGRDLAQGTGGNQPALQADGSILFDGTDDFLKTAAFTANQPYSIYLLMKQPTWTNGDFISDGLVVSSALKQEGTTPQVRINCGATFAGATQLTVDVYGVLSAVANGASSSIQINNNAALTGDASTNGLDGLTLGSSRVPSLYSNIQVKEVILYAAAHDANTLEKTVRYLGRIGQIAV